MVASADPVSETLRTWNFGKGSRASDEALAGKRRVDWPLTLGRCPPLLPQAPTAEASVSEPLTAVEELHRYRDHGTLLRRAVELGRERLGLPRAALFLLGNAPELLHGTWGTSLAGTTTDERGIAFLMGAAHREAVARRVAGSGRWLLLDRVPLTAQVNQRTVVIGHGWNALVPIVSARGVVGLFVSDAGVTGNAVDTAQQAQVVVYCALLGNLLELSKRERATLGLARHEARPPASQAAGPELAQARCSEMVARAAALLERDPNLSRAALASAVGASGSLLSRSFKTEMGVSISHFRSRLRLERFLILVDPAGGNLLAAALDSGFGSYAQFHRVFRAAFGLSPKDYLAERRGAPMRRESPSGGA